MSSPTGTSICHRRWFCVAALALFDKPDPLDGPYFEETIYATPSRENSQTQRAIVETTQRAASALEKAIAAQGAQQAQNARPERRAEIQELGQRYCKYIDDNDWTRLRTLFTDDAAMAGQTGSPWFMISQATMIAPSPSSDPIARSTTPAASGMTSAIASSNR